MGYTYTSTLPLVVLWIIATFATYIAWLAYTVCAYDRFGKIVAIIGGIAILLISAMPIIHVIREQGALTEGLSVALGIGLAGIWFAALTILSKALLSRLDRSIQEYNHE